MNTKRTITTSLRSILILMFLVGGLGFAQISGNDAAAIEVPEPYLVKDINPSSEGSIDDMRVANLDGMLLFTANDGGYGEELWKSDGTGAGTVMVKDINPGSNGTGFGYQPVNVDSTILMDVDDGIHGHELWKSDGTANGTVLFKDINPSGGSSPGELTDVNGTLFFRASDGVHGFELWKSDGTDFGTVMVKDINPSWWSSPYELTDVNGTLFFYASEEIGPPFGPDCELWVSDGTADGTLLVKDINPGSEGSCYVYGEREMNLTDVNGTLFFNANDGIHGHELWKSDGTANGTVLVKDINPSGGSDPSDLTDVNGTLFFSADDGVHSRELWKSDGTPEGTQMVKDIVPGESDDGSGPRELTNLNGTLFFAAWSEVYDEDLMQSDAELWKSDGTIEGTVMVKDINPGIYDSHPNELRDIDGVLYFRADDGTHGVEMWRSDDTEAGTVLVKDINPGTADSNPENVIKVNDTIFFEADDGVHGKELWALEVAGSLNQFVHLPVIRK